MSERKSPLIRITPGAWMKIQALVVGYDKEVAWYATVEKIGKLEYRMKDILVYPQIASSAYVEDTIVGNDTSEMNEWYDSLSDEQYNTRRGQGHSHVNMSVTPSSTDKDFWKSFALSMEKAINPYVITMIINKKLDMMWWVCDWEEGKEYVNSDIDVVIEVDETGMTNVEFFEASKLLVRDRKVYKPSSYYVFGGNEKSQSSAGTYIFNTKSKYTTSYSTASKELSVVKKDDDKKKEKDKDKKKDKDKSSDFYDEYCDELYGMYRDYSDWYDYDTAINNDYFGGDSYLININDAGSCVSKCKDVDSYDCDIICYNRFFDKFAFKYRVTKPSDDNKLADTNSVAMTIYDSLTERPDISNFAVFDVDDELMEMNDEKSVEEVMSLPVVDCEIWTYEEGTKNEYTELTIIVPAHLSK